MNFDLISRHIVPKFVLDIGARTGDWAKEAKAAWPDAHFFLIEGNPECRDALEASGFDYALRALSDAEKTVDFYVIKGCPMATGASYYREKTPFFEGDKASVIQVDTTTLSILIGCRPNLNVALHRAENILIKIDTQGSELDIMRGGEGLIHVANSVILELSRIEYNIGAPLCDEVDEYMRSKGFEPVEVLGDIVHVTSREVIQNDVLYMRKK